MGLAWLVTACGCACTVIRHDGGTIGQSAFLRMVPDKDVAKSTISQDPDGRI